MADRHIVIVGGGIIGCSTAYFLTRHPSYDAQRHRITLIESSKIAGGASGKAGGLLGLWAYPACLVPLSFRLHSELADEHGGQDAWGYRRMHVGSLEAIGQAIPRTSNKQEQTSISLHKRDGLDSNDMETTTTLPADLDWIAGATQPEYSEMGTPEDTAQVHPYQFTTAMARLAQAAGLHVVHGTVTDIERNKHGVQAVAYKDHTSAQRLDATDVIVAAGPWTQRVLAEAPISAMRAHSVTIRPAKPISAYALFTEIRLPASFGKTDTFVKAKKAHQKIVSPEIYARPGNEAYVCGEGDRLVPLPSTSAEVETDDSRCQDIIDYVSTISPELRDGEVTVRQACYLPSVQSAVSQGPLVGKTHTPGLLVAAGHTCWGIQNGPGTGKLMAEFVFDGQAKSANVDSLDPRRILR